MTVMGRLTPNPALASYFEACSQPYRTRSAGSAPGSSDKLKPPFADLPYEPPTDSRYAHGQGEDPAVLSQNGRPGRLHEMYDQFDEGPVITSDQHRDALRRAGLDASRMQCSTSPVEYSSVTVHGGVGQDGVVDAVKRMGYDHVGTGGAEHGTRHDVLTPDGGRTVAVVATRRIGVAAESNRPIEHTTVTFHDASDAQRSQRPKSGRDHYARR